MARRVLPRMQPERVPWMRWPACILLVPYTASLRFDVRVFTHRSCRLLPRRASTPRRCVRVRLLPWPGCRRKVALSCFVDAPSDQLQRNCASTRHPSSVQEESSAVSSTHRRTKVVAQAAQRHQGDDAAPRAAASSSPVLCHDRGGATTIPKNEATHSFTSRRVQGRRALTVV